MPQVTDWSADNASGGAFRAQLNAILAAIQSSSQGATAPSPTVAGMPWFDTGVSPAVWRIRNAANSGWIAVAPETIAANTLRGNPTGGAAAPQDVSMAQLKTMLGFAQSIAFPGYQTLPSGLIVQWFHTPAIGSGVNTAVTLPTAFPAAHFVTLASYAGIGADAAVGSVLIGQIRDKTLTNVTIRNLGPAAAQFFCLAIGN